MVRERDRVKFEEGKAARLRGDDISRCAYGQGRYSGADAWRDGFNLVDTVLRRGRTCVKCGRDMPPRPAGAELLIRGNVLCGDCAPEEEDADLEIRRLPCGCYLSEPRYAHCGVDYGCSLHDSLAPFLVGEEAFAGAQ